MAARAARTQTPIRVAKPAALPGVEKAPLLLGEVVAIGCEVGGNVGVMVMVVSIPAAAVITEVIGVAVHVEELEDEISIELGTIGGIDVVPVFALDVLAAVEVVDADGVLAVDVVLGILDEVGSEKGGDDPKGNEDPPGPKLGLDDGFGARVENVGV